MAEFSGRANPWPAVVGADPLDWVLATDDPAARWLALTGVLGRPAGDPDVVAARAASLADPATLELVGRLPDWEAGEPFSGHQSPAYAPNLLAMLADRGVQGGDVEAVERLLDAMLAHQDSDGRFLVFAPLRGKGPAVWGSLLCDHHAVVESLVRFGRGDDPRVRVGLARMVDDLVDTPQGRAWPCRKDPVTGFRGPGRKADLCPMVTVEALRVWGRVLEAHPDPDVRPVLADVARVLLAVTQDRSHKPYLFGHGPQFRTVKWPPTWYRVDAVLDAVSGFGEVWSAPAAARGAVADLLDSLITSNVDRDGRVTPRSVYRGFETFSFGQKKQPSPFATARVWALLRRFDDLAADVPRR